MLPDLRPHSAPSFEDRFDPMATVPSISIADFKELTKGDASLVIIDVLPADAFHEAHLAGAENFCVYETGFVSKVALAHPDLLQPIVLYGEGTETLEAEVAAEKLQRAGFKSVRLLEGGLNGWRASGFPVESRPAQGVPKRTGFLSFDTERSVVIWTGRNLFNHHSGTIRVSNGGIELREGVPVQGSLQLDMNSLANTDLTDPALNAMLIAHLRDDDFFAVARFPHAEFVLRTADPIANVRAGIPNFQLTGELTMRGVTRPLSFPAVIALKSDGAYAAQALISIDRTEWGVLYGSPRFFARLGEHVVNDHIHLHLKVFTQI
jgi:polyisoprenoid-binding protein YceI/rhodanese-related sulfurtransferase